MRERNKISEDRYISADRFQVKAKYRTHNYVGSSLLHEGEQAARTWIENTYAESQKTNDPMLGASLFRAGILIATYRNGLWTNMVRPADR